MERTFAIIKPDAVARKLAGKILARIEEAGFTVKAMRLQHLTKREAEGFYAVHRERPRWVQPIRPRRHPERCGVISGSPLGAMRRMDPTRRRPPPSSSATFSAEWN
jgi:nucleoside diphosphate kinase